MPRIDPIQLLNCLSVLLSPNGGIKSTDEVMRLVKLMTKFSKKLVSKCIYIQVLKCTETELLGLFMASGGWNLVHMWLTESIVAKNWPLVRELLELLLLCPVDTDRLKTNNCPKLIKELSKDGNYVAIRALASKLVEQWLKTVKSEPVDVIKITDIPQIISEAELELKVITVKDDAVDSEDKKPVVIKNECEDNGYKEKSPECVIHGDSEIKIKKEVENESEPLPVLKISMKDGKQIISQVEDKENKSSDKESKHKENKSLDLEGKDKHKSRNKDRSHSSKSSSKSSSSKHSSSKSSSSSSDKHKKEHSSSSSRDKSKDKHSSHSSSKKSKHESSSSKKSDKSHSSSSSSSKSRDKDSTERKDKLVKDDKSKEEKSKESYKSNDKNDNQSKSPMSIQKLGKIPKLSDVKKEKPSISIEVRKPDEPKPKTVKTFHSKFRRHGLEEEVKPPPSRATLLSKKPTPPALPPTVSIPKRPSPVHNETPPEKKPKTTETVEKPGAIKLIPPKPKPMLLLESDMFMDALNASATNKKEPKKRKRRTSGSKDSNAPGEVSPPHTPTTTSPNESKPAPPRFYQDTLETEEDKEKVEKDSEPETKDEKMETSEPHTLTINGLKGVLCYHKRKGPKKSIKWKPDSELEEIQYFELDETERVNVTKTFTDMKYLERIHEREAFQKARNLSNDDVMEEKTNWRPLIPIDLEGQIHVDYGKNSKEKDIQAMRQKGTLQPLYFHKSMIPDSALEPEPETHPYTEPTVIPLEDVTGNQDNISDFRNMPWPEPKGNAPPPSSNINVPSMFPPAMTQFPNTFPPAQFPGMPGFQPPGIVPAEWQNGMPPHLMPNGIPMNPAALAPGAMPPNTIPPSLMMSPEGMMMNPEMFGAPNPMFPVPEGFPMQQNVFPPDFNMAGPPGPEVFPGNNFRGSMRGRGGPGHWRGKGPGNWEGPQRGRGAGAHMRGGGGRKTICIYFQRKGSCRQGDNCTFLHPGVNCPY